MLTGKVVRSYQLGYVEPEWLIEDYLRYAIDNYGWECIIIWGPKGGGKSNLMLQLGYMIYKNWNTVLEHIIFKPDDFIRIVDESAKAERIPFLGWDDIGVYLPSSLYSTDRDLWTAFKENWDAFRTKLNVFVCTTPIKDHVASFILHDVTGEIAVARRQGEVSRYSFQRWVWDTNLKNPLKNKFELVNVEGGDTPCYFPLTPEMSIKLGDKRFPGVPENVFKKYWEKRMELAEEARGKLVVLLRKLKEKEEKVEGETELYEKPIG